MENFRLFRKGCMKVEVCPTYYQKIRVHLSLIIKKWLFDWEDMKKIYCEYMKQEKIEEDKKERFIE